MSTRRGSRGPCAAAIDSAEVDAAVERALEPFERAQVNGEGPYQVQQELQGMMQDLVGIVRTEPRDGARARGARAVEGAGAEGSASPATANTIRGGTPRSTSTTCSGLRGGDPGGDRAKESRGGHFRDDCPEKDPAYGKFNIVVRKGTGGEMQLVREPIPEMPAELKGVIEEQT